MATLKPDGTVDRKSWWPASTGTAQAGKVQASYAALRDLLGPDEIGGEDPPGWAVRVHSPAGSMTATVTLYFTGDGSPRAYAHSAYWFTLSARPGDDWAAARLRLLIELTCR